jgi:serine/threonine-protein kinase
METADASFAETPLIGGRYQVLRRLGAGGMADVYLARDLNLQREVAVKVLRQDFTEEPSFRVNFLQEARAAANLSHPNIVTIFDFGHEPGQYYIIMEYMEGTDLKTLMRRRGLIPVQEASELMIQICDGVGYAHRAGLVHCDLKPQNILISPYGKAKITDFGISRALATIHPDERQDTVWGSPQYFSPEQARGAAPSPASDVYSLGVVLYEMLTGRLPFEAASADLLAELHLHAPVTPASHHNLDLPEMLDRILLKVLSKEPAARYRTADQLGRVLESFLSHSQALQTDPAAPSLPIHDLPTALQPAEDRVDWLAAGLGLLALIAVGGLVPLWLWVWLLYR